MSEDLFAAFCPHGEVKSTGPTPERCACCGCWFGPPPVSPVCVTCERGRIEMPHAVSTEPRCAYRETWPPSSGHGPMKMRCVLRDRHGPGVSDPGNAMTPGNQSHHLDVEYADEEKR